MVHNIKDLLTKNLMDKLKIPGDIRREFLEESVRKNDISLQIICAIIFAIECFNLVRVVFLSPSGLGTRNNQIYFAMYCILIAFAAFWLILRHPLRRAPVQYQGAAQYIMTSLIFLWHLGLNTYDLYRDPDAGITVLTTALLALSLLIQIPPWYSLVQFIAGYLLFRIWMAPLLDGGGRLNLTISFVVALAVSLIHAHHTSVALSQQKQIVQMNRKLQELARRDPLTRLLNKTTMEYRAEQLLRSMRQREWSGGLTLFLLDLDQFKQINDRYGHPCGDYVLTETAEYIRQVFSPASGLGRIGGDEFAVLYDCPLTEEEAAFAGRQLLERMEHMQWEGRPLEQIGCSIGVCVSTLPQCSYRQLYIEADRMLYQAKEAGRGRCCFRRLELVKAN